jgi:hypothetical protein
MMKTRFGSAVFLALATVTTVVFAQSNPVPPQSTPQSPTAQPPTTQAPPTAAPSPPAPAAQDKDRQVTLTGCLENAPAAPVGASGTPAEAAKRLVLTNATSAADSAAKTVTPPGSPVGRTYQLIANEAALTPYVGKKVELTGTVELPAPPAASPNPAQDAASTAVSAVLPRLRVESGKALPTSCAS